MPETWPIPEGDNSTISQEVPGTAEEPDLTEVRLWHLADTDFDAEHVCFGAKSGHPIGRARCRLMTQNGHSTSHAIATKIRRKKPDFWQAQGEAAAASAFLASRRISSNSVIASFTKSSISASVIRCAEIARSGIRLSALDFTKICT